MKYKVQIEAPADNADPKIIEAFKAISPALGSEEDVKTSVILSNTPDSYSLTVHTLPEEPS